MVILEKIEENTLALHDRFFFFVFFVPIKMKLQVDRLTILVIIAG